MTNAIKLKRNIFQGWKKTNFLVLIKEIFVGPLHLYDVTVIHFVALITFM